MTKFRTLNPDEIEIRVGTVGKKGATLLLYKNARADMNILDECVGADNWQREHYECKGNLFCRVGIDIGNERWCWKSDCGTESYTEKEKGEASDSFKRACVNWGIGRELYTAPFIFYFCTTKETNGKYQLAYEDQNYLRYVKVASISYDDNKRITELTLIDADGEVMYQYPKDEPNPKKKNTVKKTEKAESTYNADDNEKAFNDVLEKPKYVKELYDLIGQDEKRWDKLFAYYKVNNTDMMTLDQIKEAIEIVKQGK